MNGKQLKNSILQWAIQGKLVPQDPNDEPASVLLERIRAEKARLVKEGKIKKDKNESIIFRGEDNSHYEKFPDGRIVCIDDEIPFEVPQGWEWTRLGAVFELKSGQDFPPEKYSSCREGTLYLTGASNIEGEKIIENRWTKTPTVIAPFGSLLLVCKGSGIGKMCLMNLSEAHIARQFQAIIPLSNDIDIKFTRLALECRLHDVTRKANGVIPGIDREAVLSFLLPVPPHVEQTRILEKISLLSYLTETYGKQQVLLEALNEGISDRLKKSILQEAISGRLVNQNSSDEPAPILLSKISQEKQKLLKKGKLKKKELIDSVIFKGEDNKYYETIAGRSYEIELPYSIPESWVIMRLKTICALQDGERRTGDGICLDAKYLRGKTAGDHIQSGKYVCAGSNIILVDGENSGEVFTTPVDGYMGSTFKKLWISDNLHIPYVLAFIRFYKDELRNSKKGAAIPHLNKEIFNNLIIGIPPIEEQKRIVQRLVEITSAL